MSLVLINYHILFSLLRSLDTLTRKEASGGKSNLECVTLGLIEESFKRLCSLSNESSEWCLRYVNGNNDINLTKIIRAEQSSLISTLALKDRVNTCVIMRLVSIYFQWCSPKVFEPMNVYEKCKVFMCSMRCSDSNSELECMIKCLNEIILNKETSRDLRVILLKEHLSYLLKLASTAVSHSNEDEPIATSGLLSLTTENGLRTVSSLIDLFESMVFLVNDSSHVDAPSNGMLFCFF